MELQHLYQCQIHPHHYSRKLGGCIECIEEWERKERVERERKRVQTMEKKARDTGKADLVITKDNQGPGTVTKHGKNGQTQNQKASAAQKPGKWPKKQRQQMTGAPLAPEIPEVLREDGEQPRGKAKTQGISLYKAKKKWKD